MYEDCIQVLKSVEYALNTGAKLKNRLEQQRNILILQFWSCRTWKNYHCERNEDPLFWADFEKEFSKCLIEIDNIYRVVRPVRVMVEEVREAQEEL